MLHRAKTGDVVHYQFFFGDGTPFDGKTRPLVLLELRGESHLVLPLSACKDILPKGHQAVPICAKDFIRVWDSFLDGVVVIWPKVCRVSGLVPMGTMCNCRVNYLRFLAKQSSLH